MRFGFISLVAGVLFSLVACTPSSSAAPGATVQAVATTTVFADLVAQVGGDRVSVRSLVPAGGEPHTFDPRPSDVTAFVDADLVVMNGLGLDDWVVDLVSEAGSEAPVLRLGEDLSGAEYIADEEEGGPNPHLWLNVAYAMGYVDRIAQALAQLDPDGATEYEIRASEYRVELEELDTFARDELGAIPAERRRVVSFHEAFPYFAAAYGLEVVGVVVDAPGQDPSAGEVAALIDAMREAAVTAILAEDQFPSELVDQIAAETGVAVVADLYSDSLGDPPGDSYVGMIRYDVERLVEALH
jgi:zinc/manganese transport system substrate-binding protein/manganese/iron transport system substrate-binding protein